MIYHRTVKQGVVELEETVVTPDGTRVTVELATDEDAANGQRKLGSMQGAVLFIAPDFDAPLDDFQDYIP